MDQITLRAAREAAGLDTQTAAARIGVADTRLETWESKPQNVPGLYGKRIAAAYGVSVDRLNFSAER